MRAPTVYHLTTLKDVFDQVPPDKIELCMAELGRAMLYLHELGALAGEPLSWNGPCDWIDDGKTDQAIDVVSSLSGEPLLTFRATTDAPPPAPMPASALTTPQG
jgi:hypothetical protein